MNKHENATPQTGDPLSVPAAEVPSALSAAASKLTGAIIALEELRIDSRICKSKHFAAADRKALSQTWFGLPAIIINLFVAYVLVKLLQAEAPPTWLSTLATALTFLAASLTAVQTFFKFGKMAEGHRSVANRYLEITRECKHLILQQPEVPLTPAKLWKHIHQLRKRYDVINQEAEAFPTNARDLKRALNRTDITPFDSRRALRAAGVDDANLPRGQCPQ